LHGFGLTTLVGAARRAAVGDALHAARAPSTGPPARRARVEPAGPTTTRPTGSGAASARTPRPIRRAARTERSTARTGAALSDLSTRVAGAFAPGGAPARHRSARSGPAAAARTTRPQRDAEDARGDPRGESRDGRARTGF
jgi:hypothetical protein